MECLAHGNQANGAPVIFRLRRSGSLENKLNVAYTLAGTARPGIDLLCESTGVFSFAAGVDEGFLVLPVLDDRQIDPGRSVIARLAPAAGLAFPPGGQSATAVIAAAGLLSASVPEGSPGRSFSQWRNPSALAMLRRDGSVITRGEAAAGGDSSAVAAALAAGVRTLASSRRAFAALRNSGSVVTWGDPAAGGDSAAVRSQLRQVTTIAATGSAFAALRADGTVVTWGDPAAGGDSSAVVPNLAGVVSLASTGSAFAALRADGTVVTWGDPAAGGDSSAVAPNLAGVVSLASTGRAFAALRNDGTAVSWGDPAAGGAGGPVAGVMRLFGNASGFAALRADGTVVSWTDGAAQPVPDLNQVQTIATTNTAFAALRVDGSVVTWGERWLGGDSRAVASELSGDVIEIASNAGAFAALRSDGSVVTWGAFRHGGDSSSVQDRLSGVVQLVGTGAIDQSYYDRGAFAALRTDGSVVTWGSYRAGADSSSVASLISSDVVQLVSTATGLAALRSDGRLVQWGYGGGGVVADNVLALASPDQTFELLPAARAMPPQISLIDDRGTGRTADGQVQVQVEPGETWEWRQRRGERWTAWQAGGVDERGVASRFNPTAGRADGPIAVEVRRINSVGRRSVASTLAFTFDTTAPAAPALALLRDTSGGQATSSVPTLTVLGLEEDENTSWQYRWQASAGPFSRWQTGSGNRINLADHGVSDGPVAVQVRQRDGAGLVSATGRLRFNLDRLAPAAPQLALLEPSAADRTLSRSGVITVAGLEPGASWQYRIDSGPWRTGRGERFSVSGDGLRFVEVRQLDISRNASAPAALTFTLDATAPAAPQLTLLNDTGSADGISRDTTVQVAGLEAGASWFWRLNDGIWRAGRGNPIRLERDGRFQLEAEQIDRAGNRSPLASLTVQRDTRAPLAPTLSLANPSATDPALTSDGTVLVSGLERNADWRWRQDGGSWRRGQGNRLRLRGDGLRSLEVEQSDGAGNRSPLASLSFRLDTTAPAAPQLALLEPSAADPSHSRSGVITVAGLEPGASWQYRIDSGRWRPGSGRRFSVSGEGSRRVEVRQLDRSRNASTPAELTFILDATAPAAPQLTLLNDTGRSDRISRDTTVQVAGLEEGASWRWRANGGVWRAGRGNPIRLGRDGRFQLEVEQTDRAGNGSPLASLAVQRDTRVPLAPTLSLANPSATDPALTSDGTVLVGGLERNTDWRWRLAGGNWRRGQGNRLQLRGNGLRSLEVEQSDGAGNSSPLASLSFRLDTTPPSRPNLRPENPLRGFPLSSRDALVAIDGLEAGGQWQLELRRAHNNRLITRLNGSEPVVDLSAWLQPTSPVRLTAVQLDAAGNRSAERSILFTQDLTTATLERDLLIGTTRPDTFRLPSLGASWLGGYDTITGYSRGDAISVDGVRYLSTITGPGPVLDSLNPTAIDREVVRPAGDTPAVFSVKGLAGTFLVLPDARPMPGFQPDRDAVLFLQDMVPTAANPLRLL